MGFRSGAIAYGRFLVHGGPDAPDLALIERLESGLMGPLPPGDPPEIRAGFTAGGHVLDDDFEPGRMIIDGEVLFGLRIDRHRVPAEVRRALRARAEQARANDLAGGDPAMLGRGARREAREEAEDQCRRELREGRHRASKHTEILWRVRERTLLAPVFGDAAVTALRDLFREHLDVSLEPLGAGGIARHRLEAAGRSRDYEDLRPTPFTAPPAQAEAEAGRDPAMPLVPWVAGVTGESQDFLGNEFLLWLWWRTVSDEGAIELDGGRMELTLDKLVEMACAWDATGTQTLRGHGPHRLPEALDGLRGGKWPRKLGLLLATAEAGAPVAIQGDRFVVSGLALPKPEDPPASDHEMTSLRLAALRDLDRGIMQLYHAFVEVRTGPGWGQVRTRMMAWVRGTGAATPPRVIVDGGGAGGGVRPPVEIEVTREDDAAASDEPATAAETAGVS
jgi:hypothetical protein